jgi:hypothetical protein
VPGAHGLGGSAGSAGTLLGKAGGQGAST